jgi:hypothetical protein
MRISLGTLTFPGYWSGNVARSSQLDGSELLAYGIEIPGTERNRYLLFRSSGSTFLLVDDFVEVGVVDAASISDEGSEWVYRSANGTVLFRRLKVKG